MSCFYQATQVTVTCCRLGKQCLFVALPFALVYQPAPEPAARAGHHVLIINGASSTPLSNVPFSLGTPFAWFLSVKEWENHYFWRNCSFGFWWLTEWVNFFTWNVLCLLPTIPELSLIKALPSTFRAFPVCRAFCDQHIVKDIIPIQRWHIDENHRYLPFMIEM